MAEIRRMAEATWTGSSREGNGTVSTHSGVLKDVDYTWKMRFEDTPGTNPEELIAAAHAGCFSMAFAGVLARAGFPPERLHTRATCIMTSKPEGGFNITGMQLNVRGKVAGIDAQKFEELARQAEQNCPVSVLLRPGLKSIELLAELE